jgi:hypothetical protein
MKPREVGPSGTNLAVYCHSGSVPSLPTCAFKVMQGAHHDVGLLGILGDVFLGGRVDYIDVDALLTAGRASAKLQRASIQILCRWCTPMVQ